jgi:hypothetical protein
MNKAGLRQIFGTEPNGEQKSEAIIRYLSGNSSPSGRGWVGKDNLLI